VVNGVSIHAAEPRDLHAAVALLQAQLREHDITTPEAALRDVVRSVVDDPRHGFILLASSGDGACAIAYAAAHLSAEHGGLIGWLEELYVVPGQRGKGVGSLLLGEVFSRAAQLGWRGVELEVVEGHERAAALYLRHGFQRAPRSRYSLIFA
jgi:GNAT superfamily N-acetyltransferase